jgi:hypothetical protein
MDMNKEESNWKYSCEIYIWGSRGGKIMKVENNLVIRNSIIFVFVKVIISRTT